MKRASIPVSDVLGSKRAPLTLALLILLAAPAAPAAGADEPSGVRPDVDPARPEDALHLVKKYCTECHGEDGPEADVRLDNFDFQSSDPAAGERMETILQVLRDRQMPPDEAQQPTTTEGERLTRWLEDRLKHFIAEARDLPPRTGNRRLTVEEYNFTMQELFGIEAEFADFLPPDPLSDAGYRNDTKRLGFSSLQIESYLDSARRAVQRYVQFGELEEEPVLYYIEFEDLFYSTADRYGTRKRAPQPVDRTTFTSRRAANLAAKPTYVDPLGPMLPGAHSEDEALRAAIPKLHQQYVCYPTRLPIGEMVVRVRAAGIPDRDGRFPRLRVEAGIAWGDGCSLDKRVLGEADVTAPLGHPQTYEFRIRVEDLPTKGPLRDEESFDRLSVFDMDQVFLSNVSCDSHAIFDRGRGAYSDLEKGSAQIAKPLREMSEKGVNFLYLDSLQIELVPGNPRNGGAYRWKVATDALKGDRHQELGVVKTFLASFMRQAYRRPVKADELADKLELFRTLRASDYSFQESFQEALAAVLVSPSFLFLQSFPPGIDTLSPASPTAHQLASRLSYLLWLSPPDEQLSDCADDGSLLRRDVLHREASRMLEAPQCRRFLESFCRQWLRLDKHANVAVDRKIYPTYDKDLASLSIAETLAYFVDVFRSDASALDLIDSNYAILNDRLAAHYGIADVPTGQLQKVSLPSSSVRGGLLTQASLMTMNSDGVDSHPIRRGVWLLDRILHSPPPPPPPNVPDIDANDPHLEGLSLKQRIELHRQPNQCQKCHRKIDPWGIPFENFDATGRWRDEVQNAVGESRMPQPVDAATRLPGGPSIEGIVALKDYLRRQRSEQFANALTHHLLTYMLGRQPGVVDRAEVKVIQERFAASDYRLRQLILAMVDSPLFYQ